MFRVLCVWSSGRKGQEQHEREEGNKEAKQLESNYNT
jgi:hypothetical protein